MQMTERTNSSINTIRHYAAIIWGNNYPLTEKYKSQRSQAKLYSMNDGEDWFTAKELTEKLRKICEATKRI